MWEDENGGKICEDIWWNRNTLGGAKNASTARDFDGYKTVWADWSTFKKCWIYMIQYATWNHLHKDG